MEFPSFHLSGRLHFARRRAPCALLTDQARHVLRVARVASRNTQTGRGATCWEICGPGKAAQWVEKTMARQRWFNQCTTQKGPVPVKYTPLQTKQHRKHHITTSQPPYQIYLGQTWASTCKHLPEIGINNLSSVLVGPMKSIRLFFLHLLPYV